MATIALSNIVEITKRVTGNKGTAMSIGGQPMACFRIAAGQAVGDTASLSSQAVPTIQTVLGPVTHNLTATTGVTAVTVTLACPTGSALTVTVGTVDVWIVGPVGTS